MKIYDIDIAVEDVRKAVTKFNNTITKICNQHPVGFIRVHPRVKNECVYYPLVDLPPGKYDLYVLKKGK
jgi:hypothetical protein